MPKSSRHKSSHKQSKHSSRGYSDSEEDVRMKEKSSNKDESLVRVYRDSLGEKRKISSQVRDEKDVKDLIGGHGNSEVSEEYVSSKRRKEKVDSVVAGDRWSGGGEERGDSERNVEKKMSKGESSKSDLKIKESSGKGEVLKLDLNNKSKRYESGGSGERKDDSLVSMGAADREEYKSKGESKRKSERDSSGRKEGKESKDRDRRPEKDKIGGQESKRGGDEAKLVDMDVVKQQVSQSVGIIDERLGKRAREISERAVHDELPNSELEKESEKRMHKKRESERDGHHDDSREGDMRRLSFKGEHADDTKYKDDKHKDSSYTDKRKEDGRKDDRQRNEKYREDADKDSKHRDDKYREDGEKDSKRRAEKHREDGDKDNRRKDEKHREDGERDSRRKDDKYREGTERDGRHRDDKYDEDGDRDYRRKDDQSREDGDRDVRRGDVRYYEDGNRDDRRKGSSYREDGERDNGHNDEKYGEDIYRDIRNKDRKPGDDFDREKRLKDSKYRDEHISFSRDRSGGKSDPKRSRDDAYVADHHSKKYGAYDDSPTRDDRTVASRDDQSRRRTNENVDYGDLRSGNTRDKIDAEKRSANSARIDPVTERGKSTTSNADGEYTYSHNRRRSSPPLNSHVAKDHYRGPKHDESKYRDYDYEEKVRRNLSYNRDYSGNSGRSEKNSSSRSLEKLGPKDGHLGELSTERRSKSDIWSSPLQLADKSPSSTDKRQFSRSDVRQSIDMEESTQRSGGSRDMKEYSGKESRGGRDAAMESLAGDDFSQADADTLSVSSPFSKNNHYNSSSKALPPPPLFRTGVDSPLPSGVADDDSRGKSSSRNRRIGDPNMGRIQGNAWRGVPSWPSPVPNGFLPFPHAPPVGFHAVMQPFPPPPMFGVRPQMELNHPSPYHMQDPNRFSGPNRPMGWRNQLDDSYNAWDASNAMFRDESQMYGRPDWDHSRGLPGGRGWDSSSDLWRGSNRTASMDMASSEKENNSIRSADEALAGQFTQPAKSEQTRSEQQAESNEISQSAKTTEKNEAETPFMEETSDVKMSTKDDVCLSHVYLSKLDISSDLAEPEIYDQCTGLTNLDQSSFFDVDDFNILYMEDAVTAKGTSPQNIPSYTLFASTDDSVFKKAMSLYKRKKDLMVEDGDKPIVLSELVSNPDQEDQNVDTNKTEKLHALDNMQVADDALPGFDIEEDKVEVNVETAQREIDVPVNADTNEKSGQPDSATDHINIGANPLSDPYVEEKSVSVESVETSAAPLPTDVKDVSAESGSKNEEQTMLGSNDERNVNYPDGNQEHLNYPDGSQERRLLDSKCGPLLSSDVSSEVEAVMPVSLVSGSVNLSRIHHSPESTH